MAEISMTPKKMLKNLPTLLDKTKTEIRERKRNILYLILSYLIENRFVTSAEALQNEAQLSGQYQACENIDLDIILQEYQSYYYTKFQKYPKIVRKLNDDETAMLNKVKKRTSAKQRTSEEKEKSVSASENEDFQFEIISLSKDNSNLSQEATIAEEKILYKFENRSSEWRDMAEKIVKEFIPKKLGVTWRDCIGLNNTIEKLKEATIYPIMYPELFKNLLTWKGVLLYGPPGTGKTLLAKALASEGFTTFINVTSSTFISKWRGESEKMLQVLFDVAKEFAPTTIFIDELDALASVSSQLQHEASRRFKSELLTQIDGITSTESNIFVLGSTNIPWNLDLALLRRFEKRIFIELPNEESRNQLLQYYIKQPHSIEKKEFLHLAEKTKNFSGSDIKTLCKEVMMTVVREKIKQINNSGNKTNAVRKICLQDVEQALETIKPCITICDCKKYYEWKDKYGSW